MVTRVDGCWIEAGTSGGHRIMKPEKLEMALFPSAILYELVPGTKHLPH